MGSGTHCSVSTGHVEVAAPQVTRATLAPTEARRSSRSLRELKASRVSDAAAQPMSATANTHIVALPMLTTTGRDRRCPPCSYGQAVMVAMVAMAPS